MIFARYYFLKQRYLTLVNREKPIRQSNAVNINRIRLVIFREARKKRLPTLKDTEQSLVFTTMCKIPLRKVVMIILKFQ